MTKTAHSLGDEGPRDLLQILFIIILIYIEVIYNQCYFAQNAMGQFREAPKIILTEINCKVIHTLFCITSMVYGYDPFPLSKIKTIQKI